MEGPAASQRRPPALPHLQSRPPAEGETLQDLRPMRGAVRPPLPLYLQLRGTEESRLVPSVHALRRRQLLHHNLLRLLLHQGFTNYKTKILQ